MIRHSRIDHYVFAQLLQGDAMVQQRIQLARRQAAWFSEELLEDVFYCFYLPLPQFESMATEPPFHRWLVRTLTEQYLYILLHPRTCGSAAASFRTALKSMMWLTATYQAEAERRKKAERTTAGPSVQQDQMSQLAGKALSDRLTSDQLEQLQRVGYRLQEAKHAAEQRQETHDKRPLTQAEIASLQDKIAELRESMRVDAVRRDKWKRQLAQAEEELAATQKRMKRLADAERESLLHLEKELGDWLQQSLRETLSVEEQETKSLDELIQSSLRIANRYWGDALGKLRRQANKHYLAWVEKLRKYPELIEMMHSVGRNVDKLLRAKRDAQRGRQPDQYDELGISNDIAHLLPSEASLWSDPDYEYWFLQKWLEGKLMTYRADEPTKSFGRGPVLCILDSSHSMRGAKLRLAQLFTMTFAALILHERRDFYLLIFGAKGELIERPLYHRKPDWPSFYAFAQLAFSGGTHFDLPLQRAIQLIRTSPTWRDADIVMVTDGIGAISASVQTELAKLAQEEVHLRLHSLIIGAARQHLNHAYDLLGISHTLRFATSWDVNDGESTSLLLDVMKNSS
jgi:uncharacterized protein with von Willebrand factor type A (vWA) domain